MERVATYCAMCVSRCGAIATLEDGRFTALEPDPAHPTGRALCAKGRAAPELVYHPERLLRPLKRTRPKGDRDPGWEPISWDEALGLAAARLTAIARDHGPESVAFSVASPSTSASDDAVVWIQRLMNAFGSPNLINSMELCGWGRFLATRYTFGAGVPGVYMPDLERAGCILFWGYNPNLARLTHATATVEAQKRGAKLIVVDPRRTVPAKRADVWLRVRPGTDAALALGIANVMIARGWFDRAFVRDWTNGPLLVRADNGRWLRESDLPAGGSERRFVAWNEKLARPVVYDPATASCEGGAERLALMGAYQVETPAGEVTCHPAFALVAERCGRYPWERVEAVCGIGRQELEAAARMLWESRPVAYYAWSGVEMQTGATQIARAVAQLYALTGSLDAPGGNVLFGSVPTADVSGHDLVRDDRRPALGFETRPLGPARWGNVTSEELYRGILERRPYGMHGLVGFGANLLLSHADGARGREALAALDFYLHADLFMNPTAEMADVVLPVTSAFESEALKPGFEVSPEAQSFVQMRQRVAEARGACRSDTEIVFGLATRLGLGEHFWQGDVEAGVRHRLGPSGVTLETLRAHPGGVRLPLVTRHRKYAERVDGVPRGFETPTGKVELYSEVMLEHGYAPLPDHEEPLVGPGSRPDLAERFPLILTSAKHALYCGSQHRALPSLRRLALEPEVELHPDAAAHRGIRAGDRVLIETPVGAVRARARLNDALEPGVVCGQHGWWQGAREIGAPAHDPFGPEGASLNLVIGSDAVDPVSGSVPQRAYLCEIRLAE